jgi:exodeoxyribonuclease-3
MGLRAHTRLDARPGRPDRGAGVRRRFAALGSRACTPTISAPPLKIATWNINGVVRRLPLLIEWLAETEPDVVALQELKASDGEFPAAALEAAGYGAAWCGQRTWNGVALLARGQQPIVSRRTLPGDDADSQARYLEAAAFGVLFTSIYLPNGNPQPGPKFDYKLAWFERLIGHAAGLVAAGHPVVLAGDYNVVPNDRDIYASRSWLDNALLQPAPREAYRRLLAQGWSDALRELHPEARLYTFWDRLRNGWPRDAGLRIDHLLVSPSLAPRLIRAGVDREMRGRANASDHAPAWIELAPSVAEPRSPRSRRTRVGT